MLMTLVMRARQTRADMATPSIQKLHDSIDVNSDMPRVPHGRGSGRAVVVTLVIVSALV